MLPKSQRTVERYFDTSVFSPPGVGGAAPTNLAGVLRILSLGNTPSTFARGPGINNWNLALFKNVPIGGRRSFQYRLEAYNVLNTVQFQDIDRTARFDANGNQINPTFGTAIGVANPTRPPRVIQLSARFNF